MRAAESHDKHLRGGPRMRAIAAHDEQVEEALA